VDNPSYCGTKETSTRVVAPFAETLREVDWRNKHVVGPIKDQGTCGSCWAFSTASCAESAWGIKTGLLFDISEQHLLDCDTGSDGCKGGNLVSP